jgi:pyridoxine 4-dehydrogenase
MCVQNFYNVAHRHDDAFINDLAQQRTAYVPFFPLCGFNRLQIPGASSVQHLRDSAAALTLPADTLARLDAIAADSEQGSH